MGRQVPLQHVDNIPEWPGDRMSELSDFFTVIGLLSPFPLIHTFDIKLILVQVLVACHGKKITEKISGGLSSKLLLDPHQDVRWSLG